MMVGWMDGMNRRLTPVPAVSADRCHPPSMGAEGCEVVFPSFLPSCPPRPSLTHCLYVYFADGLCRGVKRAQHAIYGQSMSCLSHKLHPTHTTHVTDAPSDL